MADAWGISWGSSWGESWGGDVGAPPTPQSTSPGLGAGHALRNPDAGPNTRFTNRKGVRQAQPRQAQTSPVLSDAYDAIIAKALLDREREVLAQLEDERAVEILLLLGVQ